MGKQLIMRNVAFITEQRLHLLGRAVEVLDVVFVLRPDGFYTIHKSRAGAVDKEVRLTLDECLSHIKDNPAYVG
jgi:hypothetical protein